MEQEAHDHEEQTHTEQSDIPHALAKPEFEEIEYGSVAEEQRECNAQHDDRDEDVSDLGLAEPRFPVTRIDALEIVVVAVIDATSILSA
jgi:hypothetical protein